MLQLLYRTIYIRNAYENQFSKILQLLYVILIVKKIGRRCFLIIFHLLFSLYKYVS